VSGTASWVRKYSQETGLGLFWAANLAVLWQLTAWTTVPFHFVWVSLTLFYGYRVWRDRTTGLVLGVVCLTTGIGLVHSAAAEGGPGIDELTEIPLMAAMFVAMVWHAKRRESALAEVRRSAKTEREFARDASHLLRTPIAVARGHADLIREVHEGTQTGQDAEVILSELERLSRISNRLLVLAAAGQTGFLRRERVELEELVVDCGRRWGAARRRWHIDVRAEGTISVDQEQLSDAFDAVIENALRFTSDGDEISIVADASRGRAVIEIGDSGCGIDPDRIPTVFERFRRARRGAGGGGAGLGLPLVRAIAEAHGGSVSVGRSQLGGALFRIELPGFEAGTSDTLLDAMRAARGLRGRKTVA
jgi:signal transduction histidine kinase